MIKGILVKPDCRPEIIEFEEGYKQLQKIVEGCFEMPALFDDCDIVINEEGKFNGSKPNKYLISGNKIVDIIYGNILLVDCDDQGNTISLSDDKIDKYLKIFKEDAIRI